MKSWNIFIDTSIFISSNFDLKSKVFSSLRSLCNSSHITIILTDITIDEIKANLLESVADAESIITKASSKARILRNLEEDSYKFLFNKFDKEKIFNTLKAQIVRLKKKGIYLEKPRKTLQYGEHLDVQVQHTF